jgi:hypothetical protein
MLLPREQNPWNCGYYLGAIALQVLRASPSGKCDVQVLQRGMSEAMRRDISPDQLVSAAAWLYLLEAVELDENGSIALCS